MVLLLFAICYLKVTSQSNIPHHQDSWWHTQTLQ